MKHIHLDIVRVTEAAAIAASEWVGKGDKIAADLAATDAMKDRLKRIDFRGVIAIGEGRKDDAPGLFKGDQVGQWYLPASMGRNTTIEDAMSYYDYDIAVDPLDGTTPTSKGGPEAMSVIALGRKGAFLATEDFYMWKLAYGPKIKNALEILPDTKWLARGNLPLLVGILARAANKDVSKFTVCLLDRPRHEETIASLRKIGCRIKLIQDCDVSAAIATAIPQSGIDAYLGVGGAPEGVIGAAALKCMGGEFAGILCDKEGVPQGEILHMEDLAKGDVIFCATGVTDGSLLKGVRWTENGAETHSLTMRSESGTIRWITATHGN